jgi:transposase-like protein
MTFFSIADACRLLGIDAKTLRRWLALAHLDLQPHPADARKQGLREDHLRLLARLHQRSLAPLPSHDPQPAPPTACPPPALPAALLALPQTLAAVQAQLAALQHQVAALSHRLEPPACSSPAARLACRAQPTPAPARPRRPASAAATPPRKPVHVIPRVEYDGQGRYVVICPKHGLLPLEPDTPAWCAWLAEQSSFRFVGKGGRLTAHHEWRVPKGAWRAHRHLRNHSYTLRLAPTHELTMAVLEQAALALQAHLR